jgi:Arc/MetJ family transcription regulator
MLAGHVYSQAPRCAECGGRALLVEEAVRALVRESLGRLVARRCPQEDGWHIHDPANESR